MWPSVRSCGVAFGRGGLWFTDERGCGKGLALTLALLVAGVLADDPEDAGALDNLAIVAHPLH